MRNILKPQAYLRYGDDFIVIGKNVAEVSDFRKKSIKFLKNRLNLCINCGNGVIIKAKGGLKFLGMNIYPKGRALNKKNLLRIDKKLSLKNISSYLGLAKKHLNKKSIKYYNWQVLSILKE